MAISKQALKTFHAVKQEASVPTSQIEKLLKGLGFIWRGGNHQAWRHPAGYRIILKYNQGKEVTGYQIKQIRTILTQMEEKEVINLAQEQRFKGHQLEEFKEAMNAQLQPAPTVPLVKAQEETALQVVLQALKDLQKQMASLQDLMAEIAVNVEARPVGAPVAFEPVKTKRSRKEAQAATAAVRRAACIKRIKEACKQYPELKTAKNIYALASIAKTSPKTVKEFLGIK